MFSTAKVMAQSILKGKIPKPPGLQKFSSIPTLMKQRGTKVRLAQRVGNRSVGGKVGKLSGQLGNTGLQKMGKIKGVL